MAWLCPQKDRMGCLLTRMLQYGKGSVFSENQEAQDPLGLLHSHNSRNEYLMFVSKSEGLTFVDLQNTLRREELTHSIL